METPVVLSTLQVIESAKQQLKAHAIAEGFNAALEELKSVAKTPIPLGDKAALKEADEARKKAKALRTSVERKRKELKAVALEYGNAVDATAKEISKPIEAEEQRLEASISDLAKREKEEAEREERELLQKFQARTTALFDLGATLSGDIYSLGKIRVTAERIMQFTDAEWPEKLAKIGEEAERLKAEAQRIAEEAAKAKALEEENNRLRAELEAFKAKLQAEAEHQAEAARQALKHLEEMPVAKEVVVDVVEKAVAVEEAVDNKGRYVAPKQVEPKPVVLDPEPPTLSISEQALANILKNASSQGATHYGAGFRKGVAVAKEAVLQMMQDTQNYDTRGKLRTAIEAL